MQTAKTKRGCTYANNKDFGAVCTCADNKDWSSLHMYKLQSLWPDYTWSKCKDFEAVHIVQTAKSITSLYMCKWKQLWSGCLCAISKYSDLSSHFQIAMTLEQTVYVQTAKTLTRFHMCNYQRLWPDYICENSKDTWAVCTCANSKDLNQSALMCEHTCKQWRLAMICKQHVYTFNSLVGIWANSKSCSSVHMCIH